MSTTRESTFSSSTAMLTDTFKKNLSHQIDWIKNPNNYYYLFKAKPIDIDASPEEVWKLVIDVEHYRAFSHGAVVAHVTGAVQPGKIIALDLQTDKCIGKFIPRSIEAITVVD